MREKIFLRVALDSGRFSLTCMRALSSYFFWCSSDHRTFAFFPPQSGHKRSMGIFEK